MLLQDVPADPASGQDFSAGAGASDGAGPSAGAADEQELLPTKEKRHTSNPGGDATAAVEGDKHEAHKSSSKKAAKVQLSPAP